MVKSPMSRLGAGISSLKNPEHTGSNRCPPCTVVNVGLAVLLGVVLALVWPPLGVAGTLASFAVIYLQGYLVPGTPRLTERFLPDRVLAWFEHGEPTSVQDSDEYTFETAEKLQYHRENEIDAEQYLHDVGAVETSEDGSDRSLRPSFHDRLTETMRPDSDGIGLELLAEMFDGSPDDIRIPERDYPAVAVGRRIRKWPSEPALVADVTTHELLREVSDEWLDVPVEQRVDILESVRSLFETCPGCGGDVTFDETTVQSCCRSFEVVTYRCESCEEHLVELDPEAVETRAEYKGVIP